MATRKQAATPKKSAKGKFSVKTARRETGQAAPAKKRTKSQSPLAKSFSHIKPSWRDYVQYAELAGLEGNKDAVKFIEKWRELTATEQKSLMPEDICVLAEIRPSALFAAVCGQIYEYQQGESAMLAAINHPKMVKSIADFGNKYPDNYKDRELFMRTTGSLPDKGGASVHIHNNPQAVAAAGAAALDDGVPAFRNMKQSISALDKLLPPVDAKRVIDLRPAGEKIDPIPVTAEHV
jgi:hypothetical protein